MQLNDMTLFRQQALIDGQWRDAPNGDVIAVTNPANGEQLGSVPKMGTDETREAIEAANRALPAWRAAAQLRPQDADVLRAWFNLAKAQPASEDFHRSAKLILRLRAQAIVQVGSYKASAAFIRAARKAGFSGSFYNVSFVGAESLANELGKDGSGVVVSQVVPSPRSRATSCVGRSVSRSMHTVRAGLVCQSRAAPVASRP